VDLLLISFFTVIRDCFGLLFKRNTLYIANTKDQDIHYAHSCGQKWPGICIYFLIVLFATIENSENISVASRKG
jgi:hypothetical protein